MGIERKEWHEVGQGTLEKIHVKIILLSIMMMVFDFKLKKYVKKRKDTNQRPCHLSTVLDIFQKEWLQYFQAN